MHKDIQESAAITVRVKSENTKRWTQDTYTYLGTSIWVSPKGKPTLYLQLVNNHTGRFALHKAELCRASKIYGTEMKTHFKNDDESKPIIDYRT